MRTSSADPSGVLQLACRLVAASTPNPPGDERAAAEVVVEALDGLGIQDVRVVGGAPERPNVVARVQGRGGGRSLILSGHLDTKPPGDLDAWETPPWEPVVRDGRLHGLGSADMKGAVAAMVYAAAEVAERPPAGDLVLAFTADEEVGGGGARWLSESGFLAADAAILGEPSGVMRDWDAIRVISRGLCLFRITVSGTPMHSGLADELPSTSANVAMSRLIARFADSPPSLRFPAHASVAAAPTLNPALVVSGGHGYGMIPGSASFLSDVRLVPGMTQEGVEEALAAFLAQAAADDPALAATLEVIHWHPACEIDAADPIVAAVAAAAADVLGQTPPLAAFAGGTDAPFFVAAGTPTIPSFGPGLLTAAHRPNESISIKAIEDAVALYAGTALAFLDG